MADDEPTPALTPIDSETLPGAETNPSSQFGAPLTPQGSQPPNSPQGGPSYYAAAQPGYPQPSVWPPAIQSMVYEQGNTSGTNTTVPPEVAAFKWNWGAFFFSWIWCFYHNMASWGLLILLGGSIIPGFHLVASIWLGISGHKLAWQRRRFEDGVPQLIAVETAWLKWIGWYLLIVFGLMFVVVFIGWLGHALNRP